LSPVGVFHVERKHLDAYVYFMPQNNSARSGSHKVLMPELRRDDDLAMFQVSRIRSFL